MTKNSKHLALGKQLVVISCSALVGVALMGQRAARANTADRYSVSWNAPATYGNGSWPAVAQNGVGVGFEVEEHQYGQPVQFGAVPFYYEQGTWTQGLGPPFQYDNGFASQLAADIMSSSNLVVEIHMGGIDLPRLWYRLGVMNTSSRNVGWYTESNDPYQNGFFPAIAQASNPNTGVQQFLEVHNGDDGNGNITGNLWYLTGVGNGNNTAINWNVGRQINNGEQGYLPSVAMMFDSSANNYFVVEVHQANPPGTQSGLWSDVGSLSPGASAVTWLPFTDNFDTGQSESVAICRYLGIGSSTGPAAVFEVHNGGDGTGWYHVGYINPNHSITWASNAHQFYNGGSGPINIAPRVSCTGQVGVVVYEINDNNGVGTLQRATFGLTYQ